MKMATKEEIKERREQMKILLIWKVNTKDIATTLSITERHVMREKKAIRKEIDKEFSLKKINEFITDIDAQAQEVIKQAWRVYRNDASTEKAKMQALRIVLDAVERPFKAVISPIGMEIGHISQVNIQQNVSITSIVQEIKKELEKEIIEIKK